MSKIESGPPIATAKAPLGDQATAILDAAIMNGELAPGMRLTEAELCAKYDIGRGPLREAINRLEGRKLLQRIPYAGVSVVELSFEDVVEIYQIRSVMEGLACRLAAQRMTDEELDDLRHLSRRTDPEELRNGTRYYRQPSRWDIHSSIAHGSRNARLIDALCGDTYSLLRLHRFKSVKAAGREKQALAEHDEIVAALCRRDGAAAEKIMRAHIEHALSALSSVTQT